MSTSSLNAIKGLILRGKADLATVDVWQGKGLLTAAEADTARAYWHELNDPAPEPEPAAAEPVEAAADADDGSSGG